MIATFPPGPANGLASLSLLALNLIYGHAC